MISYCEFCGIIEETKKQCPKCETTMFYLPNKIAEQARIGFQLEQRKNKERLKKERLKKEQARDTDTQNKNATKLHYPRFTNISRCGYKESDARTLEQKIVDFFATSPRHRCYSCLKSLKAAGCDVKKHVQKHGGKL